MVHALGRFNDFNGQEYKLMLQTRDYRVAEEKVAKLRKAGYLVKLHTSNDYKTIMGNEHLRNGIFGKYSTPQNRQSYDVYARRKNLVGEHQQRVKKPPYRGLFY